MVGKVDIAVAESLQAKLHLRDAQRDYLEVRDNNESLAKMRAPILINAHERYIAAKKKEVKTKRISAALTLVGIPFIPLIGANMEERESKVGAEVYKRHHSKGKL